MKTLKEIYKIEYEKSNVLSHEVTYYTVWSGAVKVWLSQPGMTVEKALRELNE